MGAPTPGLGQTDGEGSALANGQNTNATNASPTSRQLQADFSSASASGDHTPKPNVHGQAPVDETKETVEETNSTASNSTASSCPRAADDGPGQAAIHRLKVGMQHTIESMQQLKASRAEDRQRHDQQLMAATQRHDQQMMAMTTKMQRQQEEADVRTRGGLEEWRVDQILENMSTPLVIYYGSTPPRSAIHMTRRRRRRWYPT